MLENAFEEHEINKVGPDGEIVQKVSICRKEVDNGAIIPTYQLLQEFKDEYPEFSFYFVGGSDIFKSMHRWQDGQQLKDENSFLIFKRRGDCDLSKEHYPSKYVEMKIGEVREMSSSRVRQILQWENPAFHSSLTEGLLHKSNLKYVQSESLYMGSPK